MQIGFSLPANYGLSPPGNGVRDQAISQARALEGLGHQVTRLDAWQPFLGRLDVAQFFLGGAGHHGIQRTRAVVTVDQLVFAPIIDSNVSFRAYRWAARVGQLSDRVMTTPGLLREQAIAADTVVCRSHHERLRLVDGLGVPAQKCRVVLNGVEPPRSASADAARAAYALPAEFALLVGAYTQPRKNAIRLIQAVGPTGYPLVLAGNEVAGDVFDQIVALQAQYPNVIRLGFVPDPLLASLFCACTLFCLPSLHEGTGLAALQAASYGAPVLITKNGGPPEYFLEHAQYVDPLAVEDIRAGVERALARPRGDALRLHVTQKLTWEASARALITAYGG